MLDASGEVTEVGASQILLGALAGTGYDLGSVDLAPGDLLLCVTDGITERRDGERQLDDKGLATPLFSRAGARCATSAPTR
ncbi:SpoIIE family protein phosphatase [Actinomadura macra]|uniref:SpoIIE family protein phosphatase n=1 Tax=Actinomadura macra TaxID=46164 RepID=UPI002480F8E6|nr:SpoIIE family protein phosphatase [Actinomadura macra]